MKVLYFVNSFLPHTETFIYNEISEVSKYCDVKVLCLNIENSEKFPFEQLFCIGFDETLIKRKIRTFLWKLDLSFSFANKEFSKKLKSFLDSYQPDLIHCHFGFFSFYLIDNIQYKNYPIFITFHGFDASLMIEKSKQYRKRLKKLFQYGNIFPIFVSKALRNNLEHFDISSQNSTIIYLGIDTRLFIRKNYNSKDPFIFLQVSSFVEKKGQAFTLKAFKLLKDANPKLNTKLVFVGEGPLLQTIKDLSQEMRLDTFVTFVGWVDQLRVKKMMDCANVFVHHSVTSNFGDTEGIPTAIKEAMAMELPILSTEHAGISELVKEGISGFLIPERNIMLYAEKMESCLNWGYVRENREIIVKDFELRKQNKTLLQHYLNVVQ